MNVEIAHNAVPADWDRRGLPGWATTRPRCSSWRNGMSS